MSLAVLVTHHASPAAMAAAFAVVLVLSLVTVEEVERRRGSFQEAEHRV